MIGIYEVCMWDSKDYSWSNLQIEVDVDELLLKVPRHAEPEMQLAQAIGAATSVECGEKVDFWYVMHSHTMLNGDDEVTVIQQLNTWGGMRVLLAVQRLKEVKLG